VLALKKVISLELAQIVIMFICPLPASRFLTLSFDPYQPAPISIDE
jgi:hypothetical protein